MGISFQGVFPRKQHDLAETLGAIVSAELDQKGAFYGWGIRIGRYDGDWCWVYNVIGGPRVAIKRSEGKFKRVLVSTARPEELQKALVG